MIASRIGFWFHVCVWVYNDIALVQTADECVTDQDCTIKALYECCRTRETMERRCMLKLSCLNAFCLNDSDCNDQKLCCRSNKCVNKGCSGCEKDTDCYAGHVCCRSTFPFAQTVCGVDCINQACQRNNDCSGTNNECCRSKKCVKTGCSENCKSNSECFIGQYCCRKTTTLSTARGCRSSCVGEICAHDDDCGGPNECCISNTCVTTGCSGCNTNSDCTNGHYCCGGNNDDLGKCRSDCIGINCTTNDQCGNNICGSEKVCGIKQSFQPTEPPKGSSSQPSRIAVIAVCTAVVTALAVVAFKYYKRRLADNATQVHRGTVGLQTTRTQDTPLPNPPPTQEISGFNNPLQHEGSKFQNQPPHTNKNNDEFHEPNYEPLVFRNEEQEPPYQYQGLTEPSAPQNKPYQANENHGYANFPQNDQGKPDPIPADVTQHDNEGYMIPSPPQSPIFHTTQSLDATQDPQQGSSGLQIYPQNISYNPPYNPQCPGPRN